MKCVFFHELAHVAHEKVLGNLISGQDSLQEIVAQLSAQYLCFLAGKSADRFLGTSYRYIERYAGQIKVTPHKACMKVISDAEKVLVVSGNRAYRRFTLAQVETISRIKDYLEQGYTLAVSVKKAKGGDN